MKTSNRMTAFCFIVFFLSSNSSWAAPNTEALRDLYSKGECSQVLSLASQASRALENAAEAQSLLKMVEDCAVMNLHQTASLPSIYGALSVRKWSPSLDRELKHRIAAVRNRPGVETLATPALVAKEAENRYADASKKLSGMPPWPEAEGSLVIAVAAALRTLDLKPSLEQKKSALSVLAQSLPIVFRGAERSYQESFLNEFPKDPLAPKVLELLRNSIEDHYRGADEPLQLPEKEATLLAQFEDKIKKASKK